jgi:hypothetical protein
VAVRQRRRGLVWKGLTGSTPFGIIDQLSSDAGLLPLRQFDERVALTRAFADALASVSPSNLTRRPPWLPGEKARGLHGIIAAHKSAPTGRPEL